MGIKEIIIAVAIFAFIGFLIWDIEECEYGIFNERKHKKFRVVKVITTKGNYKYVAQFQLPFTRRWRNEMIWLGVDYGVSNGFDTEKEALDFIYERIEVNHPEEISTIEKTDVIPYITIE